MFEPFNQDVLQEIAEARLNGPLVARLDLDEVRQRAHLPDPAVGIDEHHARRVRKSGAMRVDLFERPEPPRHGGELLLARAHVARPPLVLDARARQLELARRARDARRLEAFLRAMQRFGRDLPLRPYGVQFGRELSRFEIEAAIGLDGALALGRSGFQRRAERGNRVEHRVKVRALALDVLFGGLDVLLRAGVVVGRGRSERRRFVARGWPLPPPPGGARRAPAVPARGAAPAAAVRSRARRRA